MVFVVLVETISLENPMFDCLKGATYSWVNIKPNLKECKAKCLSNCSCTAYMTTDIKGEGSGCAMRFGYLIDIRKLQDGGQDLYVRIHAPDLAANGELKVKIAVAVMVAIFVVCGMFLLTHYICKIRAKEGFRSTFNIVA
ncbi:hypothetical protein FEM48_Zijuj01G0215900 [Ziziphus jujuba var. spinosa]|uniref:Apple domain-containing protein n=1 Tax=Ziziphus jujuba var. spinosa TaxID=714518 RepID=A0A978W3P5_ZIZJJ|nr:hypothetical protein FEM48_Zijuj01G0215900 [Ziziphus jujuba var. spinosa]